MTRRMLINAHRSEELRLAITTGSTLDEYQVAVAAAGLTRGNIYRGIVASVNPSLDAAFLDIGVQRHALLRCGDVVPQAYQRQPGDGARHPRIDRILERGRPILVQVTKDPSGEKGAAVTTKISLAGRYLVLMPYDDVRGISRKVEDETMRQQVREIADKLQVPEGNGFIIRTNALDQNKRTLNRDLSALLRLWKRIRNELGKGRGPRLLYSDQDLIIQAVRDYLDGSIDEVVVDDEEAYNKVQATMRAFMPRAKTKLIHYSERLPLFSRFEIEPQIEAIFQPKVNLPSGGSIVVEQTEALTAVDVNSGRSKRGSGQEENAYHTNLEAAPEVARQLRLRDIGGLIVVDFIDMRSRGHQREVEKVLREEMKDGRARFTVGRLSENGLLEINRQRLKTPLVLRTHRSCPTCGGRGRIPSPETVSVALLRRVEERAAARGITGVSISLHPELADAFQNSYRQDLAVLEREHNIHIEIIAATRLHRDQEEIEWFTTREAPSRPDEAAVRVTDLAEEQAPSHAPSQGEPPVDKAEPESAEEPKPRKRRRGGRRRRKPAKPDNGSESQPGTEQGGPPPQDRPSPPPDPHPASPTAEPEQPKTEPSTDGAPPKKKRRRRRRKKPPQTSDGEQS